MTWERITEILAAIAEDEDAAESAYNPDQVSEAREWQEVIDEHSEEIAQAAHACDVQPSDVSEAYSGKFGSDAEFAEQLCRDCGDVPNLPNYIYIDWERTARDIMMDYSESDGHYFRSL